MSPVLAKRQPDRHIRQPHTDLFDRNKHFAVLRFPGFLAHSCWCMFLLHLLLAYGDLCLALFLQQFTMFSKLVGCVELNFKLNIKTFRCFVCQRTRTTIDEFVKCSICRGLTMACQRIAAGSWTSSIMSDWTKLVSSRLLYTAGKIVEHCHCWFTDCPASVFMRLPCPQSCCEILLAY